MTFKISRLTRRDFLLASGASMAAVPVLSSFRAKAGDTPPKRFVFLYNPNGTIGDSYWPNAAASDPAAALTETDFALNTILAPLQPFKDKLLLLDGVDLLVTNVGPGGPHQRGMGALLTGSELQEGTFRSDDGSLAGWSNGRSVDQELASIIGQETLLPSLELGVRTGEGEVRTRIIYSGPAQPVPPEDDPRRAFDRLAAGFATSSGDAVSSTERDLERSILDAVSSQYSQLYSAIGLEDKATLERHAELVRDIERRLDIVVDTGVGCVLREPPSLEIDSETDMPEIARLQLDLIATAFACDLTRVASLQFSSAVNNIRFPWINSLGQGHTLSHAGPSDTDATAQLIARSTWYAEQVAYLLSALAQIPEGDGSILDNTVILWGNEISIGNTHARTRIPFLMAGTAGGYFRAGRYLTYENASHTGILVSLLNAAGVDTNGWGHPDFQNGPLPGLTA